jgi:outer membrane protein assembly factor BamB
MKRWCIVVSLLVVGSSVALGADWPQWRGPNRTGVSLEKGLLKSWPEKGPPLAWTFKDAGLGFSAPAIVGDTVYLLGTRDNHDIILALDAAKGTEKWTAKIGPLFTFKSNTWGDGPRSTPTLDGNLLFALGGLGDLVCVDVNQKGKEIWRKNFGKDFDGEMMSEWGYCESPLVDGDLLICTPGGTKGSIVALDKKSGALKWRTADIKNFAPYSSAVVAELGGVRQYVQTTYAKQPDMSHVHGVGQDGKVLWTAPIVKGHLYNLAPTPIIKGNLVYVTAGGDVGACQAYEIDKDFKPKALFSKANQRVLQNNHGGVVLVGNHVFGHYKGWVCQDMKTGKVAWQERDQFECNSGALCAAENLLYLYTDDGLAALVKADPKEFETVSSFKLPERSKLKAQLPTSKDAGTWTHPVIANGKLYLRDTELLFCFDIQDKK